MIDLQQPVEVPGLAVRVFRDHARARTVYLLPVAPGVARGDDERPSLALAMYGRHVSGRFEANGAVLTMTTVLEVDRATDARARALIARRLAPDAAEAPPVEIAPIEWIDGTVTVTLSERVRLSGRPSLTAPNACAFNARLTRDAALDLAGAWRRGLPDGRIRYELRVRAIGEAGAIVVEGPIGLDGGALAAAMAETAF